MAEEKEKVLGVLNPDKTKVVETAKTEQYETIFTLVTINGETRIAVTDKIISIKKFKSVKAAKQYIDSKPWELIVNATIVVNNIEFPKK